MGELVRQDLAALVAVEHVAAAHRPHAEAGERDEHDIFSGDENTRTAARAAGIHIGVEIFKQQDLQLAVGFFPADEAERQAAAELVRGLEHHGEPLHHRLRQPHIADVAVVRTLVNEALLRGILADRDDLGILAEFHLIRPR